MLVQTYVNRIHGIRYQEVPEITKAIVHHLHKNTLMYQYFVFKVYVQSLTLSLNSACFAMYARPAIQ